MAPTAAVPVVVDVPAQALVASCALETFPTHAGTWVRCHAHDWQQLATSAPAALRCPYEAR